jgi:hypothetical protein
LYVQTRPLAFTQSAIEGDLAEVPVRIDTITRAPVFDVADVEHADVPERVIELPPLYVGPARSIAAPPDDDESERQLEPCSLWREIGPAHVVDGVGLDARRVRELC